MLYGDYIDLDTDKDLEQRSRGTDAKRSLTLFERFVGRYATGQGEPDALEPIHGGGTGLSTDPKVRLRSLPRSANARATHRPEPVPEALVEGKVVFGLSVLGNMAAGGLFLGALLLAPRALAVLIELL